MFVFHGRAPVHITLFTFIAMLLWTSSVVAQHRVLLTLAEAEDLALAGEPGQESLLAQSEAMRELGVSAGQLPDPIMRVGLANYPIEGGSFSTEGMTQAQIGIRQAFPAGDTRALSSARFSSLATQMGENAELRSRDVLTTVRNNWLDLYYWEQAHQRLVESRPFFADLATITRSLYAVGRKSQQVVLRAELELSRLDDRLIEVERQRSAARAALGEWIGLQAARPVANKLPGWSQVLPLESMQETLPEHPLLRAADAGIEARDAGVSLAEQRSKPAWALDVGYGYREGFLPSGQPRSDFISVAVTVGLPFFSKKSVDSTLSAALYERSAAESSREKMLRSLSSRLAVQYARWEDLGRRVALYDSRILDQSRENAEASMLAYQHDTGDFADVMRAYVDDLNTRIDHVRLQVERAKSYAALANLGGLPR
jgi:outer membrane protein TolC